MELGDIIRLAIVAVVGATILSAADITLGIDALDQLVDLLDLTQYIDDL
jgi:hypothetical protein